MDMKEFDKYTAIVLRVLDDLPEESFHGSPYDMGQYVLSHARMSLFAEEIKRNERYAEYLRLKAEFEPTTNQGE